MGNLIKYISVTINNYYVLSYIDNLLKLLYDLSNIFFCILKFNHVKRRIRKVNKFIK